VKTKSKKMMVAVAGQPNSGKSTIFNMLTGARQHVANYPGVTVEKKTGTYRYKGDTVELVDLPGTYSLTFYTQEERITRDFLLHEKPAAVVNIIDASNLERNLYLTFQLGEMGIPLVIALNMMDVAQSRGFKIDTEELARQLNAPVIPTVGNKGRGKKELKEAILKTCRDFHNPSFRLDYGEKLEPTLNILEQHLSKNPGLSKRYPLRWLAVKLLENDSEAKKLVKEELL
jgi:ferrous iron transport protein B